ncbi:MAG: hypothetical protein AAGF24_14725 [Cyanobacteria bacterium P01_H01_bin.121]
MQIATARIKRQYWLVWFMGRNTLTVVWAKDHPEATSRARAKKPAGYKEPVQKARLANAKELEEIRKGIWVRTRPDGSHPTRGDRKQHARQYVSQFRPQQRKFAERARLAAGTTEMLAASRDLKLQSVKLRLAIAQQQCKKKK